jgi:hypothetical protein
MTKYTLATISRLLELDTVNILGTINLEERNMILIAAS